jgi:hypothetical protein
MTAQAGWIAETKCFFVNLSIRPLSPYAQLVWLHLLNRANSTFWKFPLILRTNEIAGVVGISPSTFRRVRDELVKKRCLFYAQKEGAKTASYYLFSQVNAGTLMGNVADPPDAKVLEKGKLIIPKESKQPQPDIPRLTPEEVHAIAEKSIATARGCKETAVESWQRLTGRAPSVPTYQDLQDKKSEKNQDLQDKKSEKNKDSNNKEKPEPQEEPAEHGIFWEKYGRFPRSKTDTAAN